MPTNRGQAFICALTVLLVLAEPSTFAVTSGFADFDGITTGGEGGPTTTVTTASAFSSAVRASGPAVVQVRGTLNIGEVRPTSDKTIVGLGTNATLIGVLTIGQKDEPTVSNIIIQNLFINNPTSTGSGGGDGISIQYETPNHIWIDHCTFYDCWDGELDISHAGDFITVSWCEFYYTFIPQSPTIHNFPNLIGHNDNNAAEDSGHLRVTFHHNWWGTLCDQRMPRVRFGRVHVYNNYYDCSNNTYCVGVGVNSQLLLENNYFDRVNEPWKDWSTPTNLGYIHWNSSNVFTNGTTVPTWASNSTVFTPPYPYTLDGGRDVPALVTNNAGAGLAPFAAFAASATGGTAPLTVIFADTSTGFITDRFWDFGDGTTTSTSATNLMHTYVAPGKYLPQLVVSSPAGVSTNTLASYIDTDPPFIDLISTPSGVVSNTIGFSASATDNVALARVEFYRDDGVLLSAVTTPPYNLSLNTTTVDDGIHCFYARAYDAANNVNGSKTNCVSVDNHPPSVPVVTATSVSSNQIDLTWNASIDPGSGVAGYNVFRDESPIATTTATNYSDLGLAGATVYCYRVAAFDNVGRVSVPSARACAQTFTRVETMLGRYNGLLIQTNAPSHESSGTIRFVLDWTGAFAARLALGGARAAFDGQFDALGRATGAIPRHGLAPLQVSLRLDLAGADRITGTVSDDAFTSVLVADREVYSRANPCPLAGRFAFALEPPAGNDPKIPQGIGYGTLTVTVTGRGRATGLLGDGTRVGATAPLSRHSTWPLYDLLYNNRGASIGWVVFATNDTIEAVVDWFRPFMPNSAFFPRGFTTNVALVGHEYVAPSIYNSPSAVPNRRVTLGGGNLAGTIVKNVYVYDAGNVVVLSPNSENLQLRVNPATGQLSGRFTHPQLHKTINFKGVALQFDGTWAGYFVGADSTGSVLVEPAP
jgi:pectate lyase